MRMTTAVPHAGASLQVTSYPPVAQQTGGWVSTPDVGKRSSTATMANAMALATVVTGDLTTRTFRVWQSWQLIAVGLATRDSRRIGALGRLQRRRHLPGQCG